MKNYKIWLIAVLLGALYTLACADADMLPRQTDSHTDADVDTDTDGDADGDTDTDGDADGDTDTDGDADGDTDTDGDADGDTDTDTDTDADADSDVDADADTDADTDADGDRECSAETGVYDYCNFSKPCSCDNICGKQVILDSKAIRYKPVSSICYAECDPSAENPCPNPWEVCNKLNNSDPENFCIPKGKVSGSWQARIFESTADLGDEVTIAQQYLMDNTEITVDAGWWNPAPVFNKGLVHYGQPENTTGNYYVLSLIPEKVITYGNTVDQWMFDVYIPEDSWQKGSISLSANPAAFSVQPMLLRIVKPTVSMRTWLHGAVLRSSSFTIDNPGELCTDLQNPQGCALASGSFDIDLLGISGTLEEK